MAHSFRGRSQILFFGPQVFSLNDVLFSLLTLLVLTVSVEIPLWWFFTFDWCQSLQGWLSQPCAPWEWQRKRVTWRTCKAARSKSAGECGMHAWCGGLENENVWVISEETNFRCQLQDLWWTSLFFAASSIFCPALVWTKCGQGLSQPYFRLHRVFFYWTAKSPNRANFFERMSFCHEVMMVLQHIQGMGF